MVTSGDTKAIFDKLHKRSLGTFRKLLRERRRGRERGFSTFCFHADTEAIFVFSQHDVNFRCFHGIWV